MGVELTLVYFHLQLSAEDKVLKENLDLAVSRVYDASMGAREYLSLFFPPFFFSLFFFALFLSLSLLLIVVLFFPLSEIRKAAINLLNKEIRTSTSSMTSVPKPLKFLWPHFGALKTFYDTVNDDSKRDFADLLSVMAMTMDHGKTESLLFKLQGNADQLEEWGHEYIRNLAGEIGLEYEKRKEKKLPVDDLHAMISLIVPYNIKHNASHEAVDLLVETDGIGKIAQYLDADNFERVTNYLLACATYLTEPDDVQMLRLTYQIFQKFGAVSRQMSVALKLRDLDMVKELFESQLDPAVRRQLGFMLAREQMFIYHEDDDEVSEKLTKTVENGFRSELFRYVAADLDIKEAKTPDDVYKADLANRLPGTGTSAKQNLASTFVNGWLNCGFGTDKLMAEDGSKWIYKNKERGQLCATASLGLVHLWDPQVGVNALDALGAFSSENENVKAGLLLGVGIVNCQVKDTFEVALNMCSEGLGEESPLIIRVSSILGLGLAYAGTSNNDVGDLLKPLFEQANVPMEVVALAGLALGLIYVGTANAEVASAIIENGFFGRTTTDMESSSTRLLCLGLGLVFLGRGEQADVSRQTLQAILENEATKQFAVTSLDSCAYAGSGNVLKVQQMLHLCTDHLEKDNGHQAAAVLGLAMIAFGEPLGQAMCLRSMDHLLQYGDPVIRRAVPLALALLSVSNPDVAIMDKLSKLSHDHDAETAQAAIFGLGVIGGGSNNSRIAQLLRQLAEYYYKDPNQLFCVRLAQGLLHLGKGTLTLSPQRQGGMFTNPSAFAGLISTMYLFTDFANLVINRPYLLYVSTMALQPRFLVTVDEEGKPLQVNVRVGKSVDTVGVAGRPKTLTGFQTFKTPVLLGHAEAAELATEEYIALGVLEDVVVLKKNPEYAPGRATLK